MYYMESSVIITGINGFVGEHVAREFKNHNLPVVGIGHHDTPSDNVSPLLDQYVPCDMLDEQRLHSSLDFKNARAVIHLAGLATVGQSFEQPKRYMVDNGAMAINLLQSALDHNFKGRTIIVSTGALYDPHQPLPLSEGASTTANSPYAVGKLFVEDVAGYYRSRGLDVVVARPFNHIGPGQGPGFILPDMYGQLLEARATGKIRVGNINTKRDYTDVRDIARAYGVIALASSLQYGLYNICSGRSLSGKELLAALQRELMIDELSIEVDQSKIRPNDILEITGDSSRLQQELNWKPEIPIEQTIADYIASHSA